jgi:hypothetical protein
VWISHTERAFIRRQDAAALTFAATRAEARFHVVTRALTVLLADARTAEIFERHGLQSIAFGRSSRPAENGSVEGLAVLEGVVLGGVVAKLLSDGEIVRWLSRHHPRELAALQDACG